MGENAELRRLCETNVKRNTCFIFYEQYGSEEDYLKTNNLMYV
jgi:hypothetical protein